MATTVECTPAGRYVLDVNGAVSVLSEDEIDDLALTLAYRLDVDRIHRGTSGVMATVVAGTRKISGEIHLCYTDEAETVIDMIREVVDS